MKTKRLLLTLISLIFAGSFALAGTYTIETVPSPKVHGQNFYVSNPDSVLTPETVASLNELLSELDRAVEVEMAVVAIDTWDETEYSSTYRFALDLFNYWGVGKSDKNTGVLVLLAVGDRDIQIITGSGIEGILTDAKCGEILDENIDYLANNEWDKGLSHICHDIAMYLVEDEDNRAELLLGWHPESIEDSYMIAGYFILGCLIVILLAFRTYKKWKGKPGQTAKEIKKQAEDLQGCTGCLVVLFPLPVLFYYIYYVIASKHIKTNPLICKKCGHTMSLLPKENTESMLTKEQLKEQSLDVNTYDIWTCPDCGEKETLVHKGCFYSRYTTCPECKAKVGSLTKAVTLKAATYDHSGEKRNYYTCQCCGKEYTELMTIRKLVRSSSSSSSSWSSSSSSSSSSGSWGGGYSSGGGAGRHF